MGTRCPQNWDGFDHFTHQSVPKTGTSLSNHTHMRLKALDAWGRYLSPIPELYATSATLPEKSAQDIENTQENRVADNVADSGNVADVSATGKNSATKKPNEINDVADVAHVALFPGKRDGKNPYAIAKGLDDDGIAEFIRSPV